MKIRNIIYSLFIILIFSLIMVYAGVQTLYAAEEVEEDHSSVDSKFYLGPGDLLEILVWNDESLSKQVVVRPDGKISFCSSTWITTRSNRL